MLNKCVKGTRKRLFEKGMHPFLIFGIFFFLLAPFPKTNAAEPGLPFSQGEKITLHIKWGFIHAGEAVLEVLPPEIINGTHAKHFALTLKTSPFVDFFYKIRDRVDAFADMSLTNSLLFKKVKTGDTRKNIIVKFNWDKKLARYSNNWKKKAPISIPEGTFDPLSVYYAFRCLPISMGNTFERPVTDGKKCLTGKLDVIKKETIRLNGRDYPAILVQPHMEQLEGIFERSEKATLKIWISDDKYRIPLRIKSSVVVGNFLADMVSVSGVKGYEN